ncbi:hypothetical protein [Rhodanobacter sp. OR87]|uniref:hypothetical protein n=1 Tax=Rhodanobacter sp. OR87 TaxID=1076523 RepID=UPI00041B0B74|nr:hypothetical protein [Rhodanobacter sp. OR87]
MNSVSADQEHPPGKQNDGTLVAITLDGQERLLQEGGYKVQELKVMYGVPLDYELDEVVHGEFKPLNDERSIHIKGGEILVSHVRQGSSS